MVITFHVPDFPLLFLHNVKHGCSFLQFSLLYASIFSSLCPQTTRSVHYLYSSHFLCHLPFFPMCFGLSASYCIPAMFPYCLSTPTYIISPTLLSVSFPSLLLPQIQFDIHSPPGLNHQDLMVGPNHGSVSPQRGFCLLTVETNDLHALCLLSVARHLEAVEVIKLICLTRRATAHSHSPRLHLLQTVKAALF